MLPFDPATACNIVHEAAQLALHMHGRAAVAVKRDNTLVTEADRAVENFLHEKLGQLAPDFAFLGEETGLSGDIDEPCWVIDPIDGTTNFVRDVPLWCVSVGLVQRGQAIFGVVAVPPQDEVYWASSGQGAWRHKDGQTVQLHTSDRVELMQEDLIACNTTVEKVLDFTNVPCRLRNFGSLAYHLVALARGSLCASLAHWHKLYDIAGGMCLCAESGCEARYIDGRAWTAEVSSSGSSVPLLVAPPKTLAILLERLEHVELKPVKLDPKIESELEG